MTGDGRRGRDLILPVHLLFVALLGVATLVLFAIPTGASDCCVPIAIFGVFTLGELIAILIGIAVAGVTGRHSPLAAVDAIVTAPLVALVPGAFSSEGAVLPLAMGMLVAGLASAILAARVVGEQGGAERIVLAAALVLMGAFSSAVPTTTIVPIAVLAALLWPHLERTRPNAGDAAAPSRPSAPILVRGGAPDAAAVLARRRAEPPTAPPAPPSQPSAAAPDGLPPDDRPPDPT